MKTELISTSAEDTKRIAAEFAMTLSVGDIVLLDGDLGAGKTVFSQGITAKLSDGKLNAISPTFVMLNIYNSTPKIYHFDLYRITDVSELEAIGIEEYLFGDGVCLIEWPSRAFELFEGVRTISVTILKINEDERKIIIER